MTPHMWSLQITNHIRPKPRTYRVYLDGCGRVPECTERASCGCEEAVKMVLEAGYPNTSGFRKVVKVTVMIKKKEGISDADFIEHYNNIHAKMAAEVLLRHKIITYSLTYHLQRDRTIVQDIMKGNAKLLPYDCICTFVFGSYLDFAKFMYDKDSKALTGDHDNFMDESQMKMMVGDEYMVIDNGVKVVT